MADEVRDHFNKKAGDWHRKYEAAGPLASRIALFDAGLARHTPPPADVIEIGCGTGDLSAHLAGRGYRVTACDIAEQMLDGARSAFPEAKVQWTLVKAGEALPMPEAQFDAVIASSVLEYLDDPEASLREWSKLLRPGGSAVVTVPNPAHRVRRVERVLRPAAVGMRRANLPVPTRLKSILAYLELSRNRFPLARWEAMAFRVGLVRDPLLVGDGEPLALLVFTRR